MFIFLRRISQSEEATIGLLSVDGQSLCWTLEDQYQAVKVAGETRIPAGWYDLKRRESGRLYTIYSKRWTWHRGMIEVAEVPGFTDILFHPGNTDDDTRGCILPGYSASLFGRMTVAQSRDAYESLYRKIIEAVYAGDCRLLIVDDEYPAFIEQKDLSGNTVLVRTDGLESPDTQLSDEDKEAIYKEHQRTLPEWKREQDCAAAYANGQSFIVGQMTGDGRVKRVWFQNPDRFFLYVEYETGKQLAFPWHTVQHVELA